MQNAETDRVNAIAECRFGVLTRDLEASAQFYRDVLRLEVVREWDRSAQDRGMLLRAGTGYLEIVQVTPEHPDVNPTGVWLYLEVQDVDADCGRAFEHGVPVLSWPRDEPWGHRRCRLRDPSGLTVGLFDRSPEGVERPRA